MKYINRLVIVG